jgi:hypothetical protein
MFKAKDGSEFGMSGWIVVNGSGYIAEDGIASEAEAKRVAKWINENN